MANIGVNTLADLGPHLFELPGANSSRIRGM
jgi:hypothetical protein